MSPGLAGNSFGLAGNSFGLHGGARAQVFLLKYVSYFTPFPVFLCKWLKKTVSLLETCFEALWFPQCFR